MDIRNDPVSIIIPCWNGEKFIKKCLDPVRAQGYRDIEVIVVDNGSIDGSKKLLREYPSSLALRIIESTANHGFAGALNQGIEASKGEFVLALNLDVELLPDYIEKLATVFNDPSVGSATGKLYRYPEQFGGRKVLDTTGHVMLASRTILNRGDEEEDLGQYDEKREIFGVCAAAAMYRRAMLEDLKIRGEYFDKDFFASYEDVDLAWRAANAGWKSRFVPEAVGYHVRRAFGWNATEEMLSNSKRNKFLCILKNEYFLNYLIDLPVTFAYSLDHLLYKHFRNYRLFFMTAAKKIRAFPRALMKRFAVRRTRKISPLAFRKNLHYCPKDLKKARDTFLVLFSLVVLSYFIGAGKVFGMAFIIFFLVNPAVFHVKRRFFTKAD